METVEELLLEVRDYQRELDQVVLWEGAKHVSMSKTGAHAFVSFFDFIGTSKLLLIAPVDYLTFIECTLHRYLHIHMYVETFHPTI